MSTLLLLIACTAPEEAATPTELQDAFHEAADTYKVPYSILVATSWGMSHFDQRDGAENRESGVGVMNLLTRSSFPAVDAAAEALDAAPDLLIQDARYNILGAAALMAKEARAYEDLTGETVDDLKDWYPIVAAWSGSEDPLVGEGFAEQVYNWVQWGLIAEAPTGEIIQLPPTDLPWRENIQATTGSGLIAQYIPACSSNYSNYSRTSMTYVIIHTMQGSYSGSISWFQNCSASVSAHYLVRSSDGQITQMVDEQDVAWHAGYWNHNLTSIGIEHEGYVDDASWYTDAMYRSSAALTRDICDRYGIPKDRAHIIGHNEVPGCSSGSGGGSGCHTDPGSNWDWDYYMSLVNETGSGSTSLGGSGATDGPRTGTFSGKVYVPRYGESDSCSGAISGAVSGGSFYVSGKCTLDNNPDKVTDLPVVWSGTLTGTDLDGKMSVDGHSVVFKGTLNDDGSVVATFSGSEDIGGDVGVVEFDVSINAVP